ncbi:MAG: HNH endonuclease signature motif containing protein [Coriobacteriia bacterium]
MNTALVISGNELKEVWRPYLRGEHGQYLKNNIPWNKGKKGLDIGGKETRFKEGQLPHNTKYDGCITTRKDKSGRQYFFIRVANAKWQLLHRYIWAKCYGDIPKGMVVRFKDGDTTNCDISNLQMVTMSDNMDLNRNYEKAAKSLSKTWASEKVREKYGLPRKTKLKIK